VPTHPSPPPKRRTQVLEGLEPVRKRPGMYIGSTGPRGLHHLLWEVLDNAVDEVQAGHATAVDVEMDLGSGVARVTDNGRWVAGGAGGAGGARAGARRRRRRGRGGAVGRGARRRRRPPKPGGWRDFGGGTC
jgi:hypothetical protein